jgi:hypothetical protein
MLLDVLVEEHIPPTPGFFLHIAHLGDATNIEGFRVRAGCADEKTDTIVDWRDCHLLFLCLWMC